MSDPVVAVPPLQLLSPYATPGRVNVIRRRSLVLRSKRPPPKRPQDKTAAKKLKQPPVCLPVALPPSLSNSACYTHTGYYARSPVFILLNALNFSAKSVSFYLERLHRYSMLKKCPAFIGPPCQYSMWGPEKTGSPELAAHTRAILTGQRTSV